MKSSIFFASMALVSLTACSSENDASLEKATTVSAINNIQDTISLYDFKIELLAGGSLDLKTLAGKKILIVNTASECGFTDQYENLQKLSTQYKDKIVLIGFPEIILEAKSLVPTLRLQHFVKKIMGLILLCHKKFL